LTWSDNIWPYGQIINKTPKIPSNIPKNSIFLINSRRAFDWCMNCHIWTRKIFWIFSW